MSAETAADHLIIQGSQKRIRRMPPLSLEWNQTGNKTWTVTVHEGECSGFASICLALQASDDPQVATWITLKLDEAKKLAEQIVHMHDHHNGHDSWYRVGPHYDKAATDVS